MEEKAPVFLLFCLRWTRGTMICSEEGREIEGRENGERDEALTGGSTLTNKTSGRKEEGGRKRDKGWTGKNE